MAAFVVLATLLFRMAVRRSLVRLRDDFDGTEYITFDSILSRKAIFMHLHRRHRATDIDNNDTQNSWRLMMIRMMMMVMMIMMMIVMTMIVMMIMMIMDDHADDHADGAGHEYVRRAPLLMLL